MPSKVLSNPFRVVLIPFSLCRLPKGTTRLEFVTSGRSVAISDEEVGHSPAYAMLGTLMAGKTKASAQAGPAYLRNERAFARRRADPRLQKLVLTQSGLCGEPFIG